MQASEQTHFEALYAKHITVLKLQGKADKSIESYARAVRRGARAAIVEGRAYGKVTCGTGH